MRLTFILLLFALINSCFNLAWGQEGTQFPNDFDYHNEKAQELNLINQFSESIQELKIAIDIADRNKNEEQLIDATISLGELMRRTQRFSEGLEILQAIKNSRKHPKLHVRKLGRMAAIYAENGREFEKEDKTIRPKDSIKFLLNEALNIAVKNNFEIEEASLRNELGLFIMRHESNLNAMPNLMKSGSLYWKNEDTLGYIATMINVLEEYRDTEQLKQFDELSVKLLSLSQGKKWYTAEGRVFNQIAHRYLLVGDSLNYFKWKYRTSENYSDYATQTSSQQLSSFQALYETEKYQKQAAQSDLNAAQQERALKIESSKSRNLIYSILGLIVLIGIATFIFIRERKLKNKLNQINQDLNVSNEKYQLLMVESNHRIKNNLQMVISMLEYASDDAQENGESALKRISSKIHTISSLHKHLYSDVHNELVDLRMYFAEILELYEEISSGRLSKRESITPVSIKSERIVYFGLVLNELLANTVEHNTSDVFEIDIEVTAHENGYQFKYCDHSKHDTNSSSGTGSILIAQLIKRVGGKKLTIDKSTGTYQFNFNA